MPITSIQNAISRSKISDSFSAHEYRCRGYEQGEPCACYGAILIHPDLALIDDSFRKALGEPINLTSAFRCELWNAHVGGDKKSVHRFGCASDKTSAKIREYLRSARKHLDVGSAWIPTDGDLLDQLAEIVHHICGSKRGNIIIYPDNGFIHADCWDRMAPTGHLIRMKRARGAAGYLPVQWQSSVS